MRERDQRALELLEVTDGINIDPLCPHKLLYKNKSTCNDSISIEDIYLTRTYEGQWILFFYDPYELNVTLVGILPTVKQNFRGASLKLVLDFFNELATGHFEKLLFSMYSDSAYAFMRDDVATLLGAQESGQRATK